jgi:hypothetical protein
MRTQTEIRREVADRYGYDSPKGRHWRKKVRGMSDAQVTAIWLQLKREKKNWRSEYTLIY